jgi:cation diffusion facilitator family transporter
MTESFEQARRGPTIGVAVNGALAVIKLLTGMVGHSYALIADAIESLGDVISSIIVWGGLVIASKPADENHPYGHGKAEPLAALAVATMLLGSACLIAVQAVREIRTPHHAPAVYTLPVLLVVVLIKELVYRYVVRIGRLAESTAVIADAWHHRGDALTSAAAAVGITIALVGGEGYEPADEWAALAACLIIVANGFRIARNSIAELMDTSPAISLASAIEADALIVNGALFVEKVLVRKAGPRLFVELHLEVDPNLSVRDAHAIAHAVKDSIMARWPRVADVLIHVEPHVDRAAVVGS